MRDKMKMQKGKAPKPKVPCDAGHRSAGHSFGDYNQKELLRGMKVEFEHTRDPDVACLLYTSPSPRDRTRSRMPSSA